MAGARRKARRLALQALYEVDAARHEVEGVVNRLLDREGLTGENAGFVRELVNGVARNKEKLDLHIKSFAPAWPIDQIPVVDRNILRLAIFEILLDNKVSLKVAINEAVELAKTFGSDSSPRFVNGVLGSVSTLISK
jgi:N utilization substance protein B